MVGIVRIRQISATVDEAWTVLADFGAISQWAPNVDHSCLMSDQASGLGAVRRIQAGRTTLVERVIEWEAGSALAYVIEGLPPIVRSVANRWTLEPTDHGVLVTLTAEVDAGPRPPQRLAARAIGRRLATTADQMLGGLDRHLVEQGSAAR